MNGYARSDLSLDWDDFLEGDVSAFCENPSESLGCMKCVELLD